MIPTELNYDGERIGKATRKIQPSLDWKIDFENGRILSNCDTEETIRQAIFIILSTERYEEVSHTWNFGFERKDLFEREKPYVIPQLQSRITDALLQDDRIINVNDFKFDIQNRSYHVAFVVTTVYGEKIAYETEV